MKQDKYIDFVKALQGFVEMADKKSKTVNKFLYAVWGFILTFGTASLISAIATLLKVLHI